MRTMGWITGGVLLLVAAGLMAPAQAAKIELIQFDEATGTAIISIDGG
jgi:hypothetical protein